MQRYKPAQAPRGYPPAQAPRGYPPAQAPRGYPPQHQQHQQQPPQGYPPQQYQQQPPQQGYAPPQYQQQQQAAAPPPAQQRYAQAAPPQYGQQPRPPAHQPRGYPPQQRYAQAQPPARPPPAQQRYPPQQQQQYAPPRQPQHQRPRGPPPPLRQPRPPSRPPPPIVAPSSSSAAAAIVPLGARSGDAAAAVKKTALPELRTEGLRAYLDEVAPLDSDEGAQRRQLALSGLNDLFLKWVAQMWIEKGLPAERAHEAGGKIVISGSYRLGVVAQDGDIDTICLCPTHCTLDDFFGSFIEQLEADSRVTELNSIPDAKVALATMFFNGIDIDLIPVILPLKTVETSLDISDINVLRGVQERFVRSLNGPRDTARTIELVDRRTAAQKLACSPAAPIMEPFQTCLRAMNHWRKQRKIDKNKFGYFGGINMQLMAAFVTKTLHGVESSATLFHRFFYVFQLQMAKGWGPDLPVRLVPNPPPPSFEVEGDYSWSVDNVRRNAPHLMPLITPCFPTMDSLFGVNKATYRVMHDEMIRGESHLNDLSAAMNGADGLSVAEERAKWEELFEPVCFPALYNHFIQVTIEAGSDAQMRKWKGFVESRLRGLTADLARLPFNRVRPWPQGFAVLPLLDLPEQTLKKVLKKGKAKGKGASSSAKGGGDAGEDEADAAVETVATLTKLKVKELQALCVELDLATKGKKSVLVERLLEAQAAKIAANEAAKKEASTEETDGGEKKKKEEGEDGEEKAEDSEDGGFDSDDGGGGGAARERVALKYIYLIGVEIDKQRLGSKPLNLSQKAFFFVTKLMNHKLRTMDANPDAMAVSTQQVHFNNLEPAVFESFGGRELVAAQRDVRRRAKAKARKAKKEELSRLAREQLRERMDAANDAVTGGGTKRPRDSEESFSLTGSLAAGLSALARPLKRDKRRCVILLRELPLSLSLSLFSPPPLFLCATFDRTN